jgi:hypothetical protein
VLNVWRPNRKLRVAEEKKKEGRKEGRKEGDLYEGRSGGCGNSD